MSEFDRAPNLKSRPIWEPTHGWVFTRGLTDERHLKLFQEGSYKSGQSILKQHAQYVWSFDWRPKEEMIFIYGGDRSLPEKIWSEDMSSRKELKIINSTTHNPAIVYNLLGGQLSNAEPVFIYYTFIRSKCIYIDFT